MLDGNAMETRSARQGWSRLYTSVTVYSSQKYGLRKQAQDMEYVSLNLLKVASSLFLLSSILGVLTRKENFRPFQLDN